MALFSRKQNTEAKVSAPAAEAPAKSKGASVKTYRDLSHILSRPRITEKATMLQSGGTYVFDISENATKPQIVQAVREMYKVTPTKVRVVTVLRKVKRSMRTGRTGVSGGGRKAYIFLKKGDSITLA